MTIALYTRLDCVGKHKPNKRGGDVYALGLKKETNTEGLRIYVGGQALSDQLLFRHLVFGGYKTVVEVFRGPNFYDSD